MSYDALISMVAYNNCDFTESAVESLLRVTQGDYRIVVVNNGSQDRTLDWMVSHSGDPRLMFFGFRDRVALATAANAGWRQGIDFWGMPEHFIWINNDIEVIDESWIDDLLGPLRENPKRLAGPHYVDFNSQTAIDGKILPYIEGWCLAFPRMFWEEMGGAPLNEEFDPYWYEDVWVCTEAAFRGYELVGTPAVGIYHYGSVSIWQEGPENWNPVMQRVRATFERLYYERKTECESRLLAPAAS